jgi:hypothetical protein
MKEYYYKIESKNKKRTGTGFIVTAIVYTVRRGKIVDIGTIKWDTSSTKGEKSEVYQFLMKNKFVSVKEYTNNRGYYRLDNSIVKISEL